ncbi:MAG: hypothetical protein CML68_02110 [Rhodobacteraceae bacterium]|nr:hypothetical protein [Paracoccaceae bacterium]
MTRLSILGLSFLGLCAALLPASVAAQTIPVPLADTLETRQVAVVVTPGVRSMGQVPSARLRDLRRRMHQGVDLPVSALKELADLGDGLAAQRYARKLLDRPGASASDIAYYAAVAVGTGRVWTLPDMIKAMRSLDPATEPRTRVRKYISVLYGHAWGGNSLALDAVEEFNGEGRLFGALTDTTRERMIAQSGENGGGRLELKLALALLEDGAATGGMTDPQRDETRRLLEQAARADSLAARVTAENLLALMEAQYGVN